jgi:hypothetical protein
LHLEGISTVPGIDGTPIASVGLTSYYSSNSTVGNHTAIPGNITTGSQAIRDIYKFTAYLGLAWHTFGWTADWTGSQGNCFSGTYCQYYVHYTPDEQLGHWGLRQTFRLHPGAQTFDDGAIMVGRWTWGGSGDPSPDPYWIKPGFFFTWLFNKKGAPLSSDLSSPSLFCHPENNCSAYQRFSVGYVWRNTSGVWSSVACPDYDSSYLVTITDTLMAVDAYFQDDPGPQYQPWANSRIDLTGNGVIRIDEILAVTESYLDACFP